MRIAIVIAGALVAYAINPDLWKGIYASEGITLIIMLFGIVLLTLDLVEIGRKR